MTARNFAAAGAALAAVIALAGCGGSSGASVDTLGTPSSASSSGSAAPSSAAAPGGCSAVPSTKPSPQHFTSEPPVTIDRSTYVATIRTNCGTIVVDLDGAAAPHTVNSFKFLADHRYFDNTPCHRLTTAGIFVLQCGDPTGTGTGGPGYTIPDENLKGAKYPAGTVAMANTGRPHSGGSQFFFVYKKTHLQPAYTPFGKIVRGLDVLRAIAANGTATGGPDGPPKDPVVIESFQVTPAQG